jgi:hypothetical protein
LEILKIKYLGILPASSSREKTLESGERGLGLKSSFLASRSIPSQVFGFSNRPKGPVELFLMLSKE